MITLGIILAYAIIGTALGRILYVKKLGNSFRYVMGSAYDDYSNERVTALIETEDQKSAQTYGLWSFVMWPITLAFFLIQAPTPHEKRVRAKMELEEIRLQLKEISEQYELDLK